MTEILIISHDVVDQCMAGPGIRYWELARVLAQQFHTTVAAPGRTSLTGEGFELLTYSTDQLQVLAARAEKADVVLAYGYAVRQFPFLAEITTPWIADVYVPEPTEALAWQASASASQREQNHRQVLQMLEPLARRAALLICANERQRDFWLGVLAAYGRLDPQVFAQDPTVRSLVDVVPFGLPSAPPCHRRAMLKGVVPGIGADDRVILWGGGLWDWLDPLTLLRALVQVIKVQPNTRLVFPGTRHPNVEQVPDTAMRQRVETLTRELRLEAHVFSGQWLPYAERENYLLEADVGASLHFDTIETRFAFRTRVLDYIWAGLPMVVTGGDSLSELVLAYGLGEVVPPNDHEAVAAAILHLFAAPNLPEIYRERFEQVRPGFTWERACEPIVRFCEQPRRAHPEADSRPAPADSPSYRVSELETETARLRALVSAYERGRFMRFMTWLASVRSRLSGSSARNMSC